MGILGWDVRKGRGGRTRAGRWLGDGCGVGWEVGVGWMTDGYGVDGEWNVRRGGAAKQTEAVGRAAIGIG